MNKPSFETMTQWAAICKACSLCKGRIEPVFSKGDQKASIVICGMCPGPEENYAGVPFVGRAGKILDLVLTQVFHRDGDRLYNGIYITNLVKCFVAPGTALQKEWMDTCLPYFISELGLLPAKHLILLGKDVSNYLLGNTEKIGALRSKDFEYMGIKTICTYHPSYIVRGGGEQADAFWEVVKDFNRIL